MPRRLIPALLAASLLGTQPLAAQFETPVNKKLCALVQPADLTQLLQTPQPAAGRGMGNQCQWMSVLTVNGQTKRIVLSITTVEPNKGETPEQAYTRLHAKDMAARKAIDTQDETGIGDQAYSWFQDGLQAHFVVYTKGQLLRFWTMSTSDRDALRAVVKKAVAAYT
jgi:hypothetical protein